jgi:hypothetical protein
VSQSRTYGFGRRGRLLVLSLRSLLLVLTIGLAIGSALGGTLDATSGIALGAFGALQAFFFYRARDVVHGAVIHPDGAVELTCAFKVARLAPEDFEALEPVEGGRYVRMVAGEERFDVPTSGEMREVIRHVLRENPRVSPESSPP